MMSMLNTAHVEAICSATYLENYVDCLESLPDELQRLVSQIREIDVKLAVYEKECGAFEEMLETTTAEKPLDSKSIVQLEKILLHIQECEDEKIQLSSAMMEFIEVRSRQLDQDLDNVEPQANNSESAPAKNSNRRESKNEKPNAKQITEPPVTTPATPVPTSKRRRAIRSEPSALPIHSRTIQPKVDEPPPVKKSNVTILESKPAASTKQSAAITKRKRRSNKTEKKEEKLNVEPDEPTYCLCGQISYGEMIGCDNDNCPIEWFHFNCVNLTNKPKGKWFCPKCRGDKSNLMKKR